MQILPKYLIALSALLGSPKLFAQLPTSDNGDGTFTNPVLRADNPDPDVILVGNQFYFVSSSFHFVPGDPILQSNDLVNWKIIGHAIPHYDTQLCGTRYDMIGGYAYGFGSWAPSIRYHDGVFYVCYWIKAFDEKKLGRAGDFYVSRATNPSGPWTINKIDASLYDPGLFFDDDGRVYVIHGQNSIFCTELDQDLKQIKTPPKLLFDCAKLKIPGAVEGSHVYKGNGFYYIFTPCGSPGDSRWGQMAFRSKSIYGPYESKLVFEDNFNWPRSGAHQGALVQTKLGQWWAILFQGRGKFGRIPVMVPVHWENDWPILTPGMTFTKPITSNEAKPESDRLSDDFTDSKIGLQWQWNHNPDNNAWSLTERPGWLRIKTSTVSEYWAEARNTLTQPAPFDATTVTTLVDVSRMSDGDVAGLGMMQLGSCYIAVAKESSQKSLITVNELYQQTPEQKYRKIISSIPLEEDQIYLRATRNDSEFDVQYSYSVDDKTYTPLGGKMSIEYILNRRWVGMRFGVFNYSRKSPGGSVDFDFVHFDFQKFSHRSNEVQKIEAERYDAQADTQVTFCNDEIKEGYDRSIRPTKSGAWIRFDNVNFTRAVNGFRCRTKSATADSRCCIEIRIDAPDGQLAGSIVNPAESKMSEFQTLQTQIDNIVGTHAIYIVFRSYTTPPEINWIQFSSGN